MLESLTHEKNSFLTLTYSPENLPLTQEYVPTLRPEDLTLFIKRLRSRIPHKIRYYAVGEYGHKGERGLNPHFHLCVFGMGEEYERAVAEAWQKETGRGRHKNRTPLGFTYTGSLTPQSAAYVAGYVQKKTDNYKDLYENMGVHPEYCRMSNRPGIGAMAIEPIARAIALGDHFTPAGDVPISLKHGNRLLPLGNYLREKLREELNLDHTMETYMDDKTGEIEERKIWHGKERQKDLYKAEMQHLLENPQENKEAGPLPEKAHYSLKTYLDWKNAQSVLNHEKRQEIFRKEKTL